MFTKRQDKNPFQQLIKKLLTREATPTHGLHRRNIYILPTKSGMMLCMTLVLLLVTSINFQLNLGYALTFLILGAAFASTFTAYRNLSSLRISFQRISNTFVGNSLTYTLQQESTSQRKHYSIGMSKRVPKLRKMKEDAWVWCDVLPNEATVITLSEEAMTRGWYKVPELVIKTNFPMGVFCAWSIWKPLQHTIIYPFIEESPPSLRTSQNHSNSDDEDDSTQAILSHQQGQEFDSIRPYRAGDPMKQIYWKKVHPSGDLFSRETSPVRNENLWLTLESTGLSHLEEQLSRLTAWVLEAEKLGVSYGLRLAGQAIAPHAGEAHQLSCLQALATFGQKSMDVTLRAASRGSND